MPSHALSEAERAVLVAVANEPRFASVPPARIVPMLAYEGTYLGSESSMARALKATTVLAMLNWLGVKPSYSRPRVSDDNTFSEALVSRDARRIAD